MANQLKDYAQTGTPSLQVTKQAREANFINKDLRAFAFKNLIIVADIDNVSNEHLTDILIEALDHTQTAYLAKDTEIKQAGNGWQIPLPVAKDTKFELGDELKPEHKPGFWFIHSPDLHPLVEKLKTLRNKQLKNA